MASGTGSPCGACRFLRRKCASDCVFAPYFCPEQGPARFAAVHRVFGASNAAKLLLHVPPPDRCEAAVTIAYEAQARIRDPVYGCVAHIFALQQQVARLQLQVMQVKAQLAQTRMANPPLPENQWQDGLSTPLPLSCPRGHWQSLSPQSSLDCIDQDPEAHPVLEVCLKQDLPMSNPCLKNREEQHRDLGDLQELAMRMMRS